MKNKPIYLWKSMKAGLKSANGGIDWKVGEWFKEDKIKICERGFHASKEPLQAMGYVNCEILARVEVRGKSIKQDDKECWSEMRIKKAYEWTKEDSVSLAIFAAEMCLKNYEKQYPDDKRPRNAIEAAKAWLKNPTKENESASAASAAWSAAASESAAWSAARSAAWSAESAAASAAWSAAASAAESAAASMEWSAESSASAKKQFNDFILKRISLKK
jgi:hypothetical protein